MIHFNGEQFSGACCVVLADGQDAAFRSALGAGSPIEFHEIRPIAKKLKLIS